MNPAVLSSQSTFLIAFMASVVIWLMFLGLFILWILDGNIKKEQALHAFVSALFSWTLTQMVKNLFPSMRPFELNGNLPLTFTLPIDGSFPSTHAAVAFALAFSVWLHNKKLGIYFIIMAIVVGLGRILSNVHFTADVVGGALIGMAVAYLLEKLHVTKLLKKI